MEQFKKSFEDMQEKVHLNAVNKGWWESDRSDGEIMALIHSEISEALEAMRKDPDMMDEKCPEFKNIEVELSDVIIRVMDYAGRKNLDIAGALLAKHEFNKTRPYKHNKLF